MNPVAPRVTAIEGPQGSGKTAALLAIQRDVKARGRNCLFMVADNSPLAFFELEKDLNRSAYAAVLVDQCSLLLLDAISKELAPKHPHTYFYLAIQR